MNTKAESTRTILPKIIIPQIIKFYTQHRECINDLILSYKKRKLERASLLKASLEKFQDDSADICVEEEVKQTAKGRKREKKKKKKKDEDKHEKSEIPAKDISLILEEEEISLYENLSHNLKYDSGLLQLEDVDVNAIVFTCKPLVLSTSKQLEEENEKEVKDLKNSGKFKSSKKKNNFDAYTSIDNMHKKTADTAGTLQSKIVSIKNYIDSNCKRSI